MSIITDNLKQGFIITLPINYVDCYCLIRAKHFAKLITSCNTYIKCAAMKTDIQLNHRIYISPLILIQFQPMAFQYFRITAKIFASLSFLLLGCMFYDVASARRPLLNCNLVSMCSDICSQFQWMHMGGQVWLC